MGPYDDGKIQHTDIFWHRDSKLIFSLIQHIYRFLYNHYTFYTFYIGISRIWGMSLMELALPSSNAVCFHRLLTFAACGEQRTSRQNQVVHCRWRLKSRIVNQDSNRRPHKKNKKKRIKVCIYFILPNARRLPWWYGLVRRRTLSNYANQLYSTIGFRTFVSSGANAPTTRTRPTP